MRGFHRLCATAVMSVAKMLTVLRRITFAHDDFNARVHQKSGNGLEADVRTCTPISSYSYPYIKSFVHAHVHRMVSAIISGLQMEIAMMYRAQSTCKRFKESNIIHTAIKILVLLKIRELDVTAEHR
jgi:hypothetical protein